jgi:steroid 5-alpha reductase family enzyme
MRKRYGALLWTILSFPIVYLSQHVLLVGISLPFYSIHFPTLSPVPASASPADVLGLSDLFISSSANATATAAAASKLSLAPSPPFNDVWDPLIAGLCLAGIVVAYFADTQLRAFMQANEQREKQGKPKTLILNSGLWYYSR